MVVGVEGFDWLLLLSGVVSGFGPWVSLTGVNQSQRVQNVLILLRNIPQII